MVLLKRKMANSIYIHIPFCKTICSYCDFCKMFYDKKYINSYLDALEYEINSKYNNEEVSTIYIGGGTPSVLSLDELNRLFDIIKVFKLAKDYEFTIEVNVNDINKEKLELFKKNNINRISIGVETINDKFLRFLNRKHTKEEIINNINLVKEYFTNFNIDLMYAFPGEELDDVLNDLDFVISLNPKHISIYSLIIEEHTKIFIDKVKPLDEELEASMYYNIISKLKDNGYNHYEISNFAKSSFESKHNLVYWNNKEYYGFGLGASGFVDNIRYTNTRSINKYMDQKVISESEEMNDSINKENELIFGLRKIDGISKKEFYSKYNCDIRDAFEIDSLIKKRLLIENSDRIYIPEDKLYISNSILVSFIGGCKNERER